jgi:hypothetical protein
MSIQEAAVALLYFYRSRFPLFNARLDRSRRSSALGRFRSVQAPAGFKLYDIDGRGDGAALSEMNARILMQVCYKNSILAYEGNCFFLRQPPNVEWLVIMSYFMRNAIGKDATRKGNAD